MSYVRDVSGSDFQYHHIASHSEERLRRTDERDYSAIIVSASKSL